MANDSKPAPSKGMHTALWIVQILLAFLFGASGAYKSFTPIAELAPKMPWVLGSGEALVRFIGGSEIAGALGLILPAGTRIKPMLTPLAALGLLTIMVLAAAFHASRGEFAGIGANVVLGGLAAFVAWGRTKRVPISPR